MWPVTVTELLIVSCCTISFMPFGSVLTVGFVVSFGISRRVSAADAHSGNATGPVGLPASDSAPPNDFEEIGLPEGCGVSTAVIASSGFRYFRITSFTSSTVTFWIASMSSSGDCRPSTATAFDHSIASPAIEFFWNSSSATSWRFAASTRSAGTPFFRSSAIIC